MKQYRPDIYKYNGLDDLIAYVPKEQRGLCVEVGSASGGSMERFARAFEKVICIDPWEGNWDKHFTVFKNRVKAYPNVCWYRESSLVGAKHIKDASADLVYIDAVHTSPHPYQDIEVMLPKVKKGGYIGGHDYNLEKFPDVVVGVRKHFPRHFVYQFSDHSWMVQI